MSILHWHYIPKLKWITDLNVKAKNLTLLWENIGENIHKFEIGKDFLNGIEKAQTRKEKTETLHFSKFKTSALWKITLINEKTSYKWKKIFVIHISVKGLLLRI